MIKPAIFIDAFINNNDKKTTFDYNLSNFIKTNWDIFIISNKILSFDKFSDIKYFEYDSHNRLLLNSEKYKLTTLIRWDRHLYFSNGGSANFYGNSYTHGFTNWTILYNLKRICKVLKRFGYDYMIRCEYDVVFKDYNLMDTIFKNFGNTEKSKNCMILPGGITSWYKGCATNFFLINVDYLDSKIPELETEEDYLNFLYKIYGDNSSSIFEILFNDLISNDCEYLDIDETKKYIENISVNISETGDLGYRHKIIYKSLLITPINDNQEFFICNLSNNTVYFNYKTFDSNDQSISSLEVVYPNCWMRKPCRKFVEIKSSEMPNDKSTIFDLTQPCGFVIK